MVIRLAKWKIKTLVLTKSKINPKPQYQRTSVWSPNKKRLLLDSILRGYDLPKFYLRKTPNDPLFNYEVTDGQQRMRAIWEFVSDVTDEQYVLGEGLIRGINTKGKKYQDLEELQGTLDNFEISIAIIEEATPEEIRSLFARLQLGATLNKVELRHALLSNIGTAIWSIVENHKFFNDSKITNSRFNHQDFVDHVVTLVYYNGKTDLKASDIERMYRDLANAQLPSYRKLISNTNRVLDLMEQINGRSKGIFKRKWYFVDIFWMLYKNLEKIKKIETENFISAFGLFNSNRLTGNKQPEKLIENPTSADYDPDLYKYIMAFNYSGNLRENIEIRNTIFEKKFFNNRNFKIKDE